MAGVEAKVKVGLDQGRLDADADQVREKVARLGQEHAEPSAGLGDAEFIERLDKIHGSLIDLSNEQYDARLGLEEHVGERLDEIRADLDEIGAKEERPKLGLEDDEFRRKMAEDKASFAGFGLLTAHPVISGLAGGVSALLPGLSAGAAGLGLLGGAGALAFAGVAKALEAHSQASQNVGVTGAQLAATSFSSAVAVQQAQQAVQQAMQQSAQDAKVSAQAIISAQQQVTAAEQQLGDAQFGEQQAQVNLTNARIQARLTLEQLTNAEKDSVLATRSAKLALEQAERQQQLTDQNAMSTQLDKEQAALAVAEAQRRVTEAEQNQVNSRQAADRASKAGVGGSQQVVQAQHAVADAVNAVRDAETQLRDARRAVAFAEEQAAYQARRDAQAVASAEQNVTNLVKEQQLAWAATMASGNQAASQFAMDMSRLTPAARRLVLELLGMHSAVQQLSATAQNAIAPGLTVFLRGLQGILPVLRTGVAEMGRAMSSAFGSFGKLMGTSAFREGLAGLLRNGVQFAQIVLPAFAGFLQVLGRIGGEKGAGLGLANLLTGLAGGLTGLVSAISPAIPAIDQLFGAIGGALKATGPLLGQVVAGLAEGLAPAVAALLPGFQVLAGTLGPTLALALRSLAPDLLPIGKAISDIVIALAPMLPLAATIVAHLTAGLAPILTALLPLFSTFAQDLPPILQGLTPLIPPLASITDLMTTRVAPALITVIGWFVKFMDINTRLVANVIRQAERWKASWSAFTSWATGLWRTFTLDIQAVWRTATDWVTSRIDAFLSGAKSALRTGVSDLGAIWHTLEGAFRVPVNFLIGTVYDQGIRRLWDDITGVVGLNSLKLPVVPQMAAGGIHPGRDTGRDDYLVRVRGGEGFLAPETVRGVGPGFVQALNSVFGGGRAAAQGGVPGFAKGGILGWIDRGISDIGKIILGGLQGIAGLVTNPAGTITRLLDRVVGTPAKGGLGQVLTALPKALIGDLARAFASDSPAGGLSIGTRGNLSGGPLGKAMARYAESFAGRVPYVWGGQTPQGWDCSGATGYWLRHFGFSPPRTSEAQWAWVQRTPRPVLGGLAFFSGSPVDPPPGHVGLITGSDQMVDAYGTGFGTRFNAIYGSSGTVWGFGVPPGSGMAAKGGGKVGSSFDGGGYLMPGPWNLTGKPEAVLDPRQTELFERFIQALERGGSQRQVVVNQQYFGPQHPTPEMRANQRRDLAIMLGGG